MENETLQILVSPLTYLELWQGLSGDFENIKEQFLHLEGLPATGPENWVAVLLKFVLREISLPDIDI